jgi:hypothetical protein
MPAFLYDIDWAHNPSMLDSKALVQCEKSNVTSSYPAFSIAAKRAAIEKEKFVYANSPLNLMILSCRSTVFRKMLECIVLTMLLIKA